MHVRMYICTYLCICRILWQIIQSLGSIIDVMILFFFFLTLFAIFGMSVCMSHTHAFMHIMFVYILYVHAYLLYVTVNAKTSLVCTW